MNEVKIIGCLVWYDESSTWLASHVAGFARVCDLIVAVDGAYALYPGARPRSHPDQAFAIQDACEAMECGLVLHRPNSVFWGNEVEKRNLSLKLAAPFATDNTWILVFDSDLLVFHAEPDIIRYELERTECNAATYTWLDGKDYQALPDEVEFARTIPASTDWTIRARSLYRWTPDLEYGPAHYTVSGTYDGEKQWVMGPEQIQGQSGRVVPACNLEYSLVAIHRRQNRALARNQDAEGYCHARDTAKVEEIDAFLAA